MQYCSVVPKEIAKSIDFHANPIGTGPFKFQLWQQGEKLVFRRNSNYFESFNGNSLPFLDGVAITFLRDKQAAFLQFIMGNTDFLSGIDASYKDEILTKENLYPFILKLDSLNKDFENAVKFNPNDGELRMKYAMILRKKQKFAKTMEQVNILCDKYPDNLTYQAQKASEIMQNGGHEEAIKLLDNILQKNHYNLYWLISNKFLKIQQPNLNHYQKITLM